MPANNTINADPQKRRIAPLLLTSYGEHWTLARRLADTLRVAEGVEVLNEVVLNQVLVRFRMPSGSADAFTRAVIRRIQADGTCWLAAACPGRLVTGGP